MAVVSTVQPAAALPQLLSWAFCTDRRLPSCPLRFAWAQPLLRTHQDSCTQHKSGFSKPCMVLKATKQPPEDQLNPQNCLVPPQTERSVTCQGPARNTAGHSTLTAHSSVTLNDSQQVSQEDESPVPTPCAAAVRADSLAGMQNTIQIHLDNSSCMQNPPPAQCQEGARLVVPNKGLKQRESSE
ncbi:hypothetical protein Anapl_00969 [Anas platyrhynchos]|uniref:Uncharacterized protein n=1 Tax=Anas platyrhynchos TaxID=8839 RepID=R0L8U6_ANAPL|nr:hypothetical protein Anapl_00969 [Anas platyrhynchos]